MALIIETMECFPKDIVMFGFNLPAPEPDHDKCLGGQTTPGILGGWLCPCLCHHTPEGE